MSINMNSLPDPNTKPAMGSIIPKGHYLATIVKSQMRTPKDVSKPDYLSAECDITEPMSGNSMGKFWINLYESEAPLVKYQLSRFINAVNLKLSGEFELKDLTKMINGRKLMVDIKPEEKKDGSAPQRSIVDIDAECFYPVETYEAPDSVFVEAVSTPETPTTYVQANY